MQVTKARQAIEVTEKRTPFAGTVSDVFMVDKTQAQLFASFGRTRGLFQDIGEWKTLNELFCQTSRRYLEEKGEKDWVEQGGVWTPKKKPSCNLISSLASQAIRELATGSGGVLWRDNSGRVLAIRILPNPSQSRESFLGFALSWPVASGLPSNLTTTKSSQAKLKEIRDDLESHAQRLRLAGHADQILWAIHSAVLAQRRSNVLLPDQWLGEMIWGGDRESWPQDWRQDVLQTLLSLMDLQFEEFRLLNQGWNPRFGRRSVAVASVEQLWVNRPEEDGCRPQCPMWAGRVHHHFYVEVGCGFLGAMENYAIGEAAQCRTYDFTDSRGKSSEELKQHRKRGQFVSVSAPTAIFGRAKWSGLSEIQQRIIQALYGEITRPIHSQKSKRTDHAFVINGNEVPGRASKSRITCPSLAKERRYIAFNGNGHRWGMGYSIVGIEGRGWLAKCGFSVSEDGTGLVKHIHSFLQHLDRVGTLLDLTVVGLNPASVEWFSLQDLLSLAKGHNAIELIRNIQLRIYGPEDYLVRCRDYFAEKGGFSDIPGGEGIETGRKGVSSGSKNLTMRIRIAGIKQTELAQLLKVSQPYVSQLLTGKRPWPKKYRKHTEKILRKRSQ